MGVLAAAVLAALAAFAAGCVGRSWLAARRERSRTATSLRAALGADAWLLRALAIIRGHMQEDERAVTITVTVSNPLAEEIGYGLRYDQDEPDRALITSEEIDGEVVLEYHDLSMPDDASPFGDLS